MPTRNGTPVSQPRVTFSQEDIDEALTRIRSVLDSGAMSKGPQTAELCDRYRAMSGRAGAVTVASGGLALEMALTAARRRPASWHVEEEVIVLPDIAHWSDYAAAVRAGWQVVWAPVDRHGQLDIPHVMEAAEAAPGRVGAILYVAMGGYVSPNLPVLEQWCADRDIALVTDMSHAVGATRDGRSALSFGLLSAASMFATKVVTGGEGGVVLADEPSVVRSVDELRDGGRGGAGWRDEYVSVGINARMSDVHAAIANVHLASLPQRHAARVAQAEAYDALLPPELERVPWDGSSLYKYVVRVPDRARFLERLVDVRPSATVYETPLWQQPGWPGGEPRLGPADASVSWAREHVALPLHETLDLSAIEFVADRVKEALA